MTNTALATWFRRPQGIRHAQPFGDFDRIFDDLLSSRFVAPATNRPVAVFPRIEMRETETGFDITAEVPGLGDEDIELTLAPGGESLVVSGTKNAEHTDESQGYFRTERSYGAFRREVALPVAVDEGGVEASLKDGILRVTLAKRPEQTPRKIAVKSS